MNKAHLSAEQAGAVIAQSCHVRASTIKRILRTITLEWQQPSLENQSGFVHLDATYWGRNWGILLAIDDGTGGILYIAFIKHETTLSYVDAVTAIVSAGYTIKGIIIDGKTELFAALNRYPIQMCQFHALQIVRRYLTQNPKMNANKELLQLCKTMTSVNERDFLEAYDAWKTRWSDSLNNRTMHKDGKSYYLHRRVRTLVNSLDFYLPYLFTFQREDCAGMPNTNNKIEGTFTDLKKNLNNHSGLTQKHRRLFIIAYFLNRQKSRADG